MSRGEEGPGKGQRMKMYLPSRGLQGWDVMILPSGMDFLLEHQMSSSAFKEAPVPDVGQKE